MAQGLDGKARVQLAPMADGGDDTLSCLKLSLGGMERPATVLDALGRPRQAAFLLLEGEGRAFVELACASGIAHIETLDAMGADTYGTGQLISLAIEQGAREVVITLGGSASTDGGVGALRALGARFYDNRGTDIASGGSGLLTLAGIDLTVLRQRCRGVKFLVATDVVNPLLGENGAAAIFGPQKGATEQQVALLDKALEQFADILETQLGLERSLRYIAGAGAAGGTGYGLSAVLGAELVSGFAYLAALSHLYEKLDWCDAVIIAEGALDEQSLSGKGTGELMKLARARGKRVWALPAVCRLSDQSSQLFDAIIATAGPDRQAQLSDISRCAAELLIRAERAI